MCVVIQGKGEYISDGVKYPALDTFSASCGMWKWDGDKKNASKTASLRSKLRGVHEFIHGKLEALPTVPSIRNAIKQIIDDAVNAAECLGTPLELRDKARTARGFYDTHLLALRGAARTPLRSGVKVAAVDVNPASASVAVASDTDADVGSKRKRGSSDSSIELTFGVGDGTAPGDAAGTADDDTTMNAVS